MGVLCRARGLPGSHFGISLPSSLFCPTRIVPNCKESRGQNSPWTIITGMASSERRQQSSSAGLAVAKPPPLMAQDDAVQLLISYHQETKHSFTKYARGPHGLDWANQPNPFRRYQGAKVVKLEQEPKIAGGDVLYADVCSGNVESKQVTKTTLAHLLFHSLALSAWKKAGPSTWSLRVNPSSGNLHPTEGYVISGGIAGLHEKPFVAHYAPKEHALEIRAELPVELWEKVAEGLPDGAFLVGFSSIFWREAWKYGERAFRYCNHDVGHAIGAVTVAGANLGWNALLLDNYGTNELNLLLGLAGGDADEDAELGRKSKADDLRGVFRSLDREHGDCVLAVFPWSRVSHSQFKRELLVPDSIISSLASVQFLGQRNALSSQHVRWRRIYEAGVASHKPSTKLSSGEVIYGSNPCPESFIGSTHYEPLMTTQVVRKRRSAVDMDGQYGIQREVFYQMLLKASVGVPGMFPYGVLPWAPEVHMAIFVHRVVDVPSGIYFLIRNEAHEKALKDSMSKKFVWEKPPGCPTVLPLYRLLTADTRNLAARLSCNQEIAGNSFFSLGMIARFEPALKERGPWMYPRLFWEAGLLGQVLYLEATALGVAATGIGCYFDDAVHEVLGIGDKEFQSLYHFTVGVPTLDRRILTLPAYPGPSADS